MSTTEIVKSKRGTSVLIVEGYSYHLNKKVNDNSKGCGGTITTLCVGDQHSIINENNCHGHLPEPEKRPQMNFKAKIKDMAKNSMDVSSQIVNRCLQDISSMSAAQLPNKAALRGIVQHVRTKDQPKIPNTIHEFTVPDYLFDLDQKQFLIGHYTSQGESVVVFCTKENFKRLFRAKCWIMDGTFSTCPNPYTQIYTIQVLVGTEMESSKFLPVVFALLSHKTQNCYYLLF